MSCSCCPLPPFLFRIGDFHTASESQLKAFLGSRVYRAATIGHRSELDAVTVNLNGTLLKLSRTAPVRDRIEGTLQLQALRNQLSTTLSATVTQPEAVLEVALWPTLPNELPTTRGALVLEGSASFAAAGGDAPLSTETRIAAAPIYGRRIWRVTVRNSGANSADVRIAFARVRSDGNIDTESAYPTPGDETASTAVAAGSQIFITGEESWEYVEIFGEAAAATTLEWSVGAED